MYEGQYNKVKNGHALHALNQSADIPIMHGIGDSKTITNININSLAVPPAQKAKVSQIKTMDDTLYVGKGAQVNPSQFPKYYYMGEG